MDKKVTFAVRGVAFAALAVCVGGFACSVPVFRYALERWPVDPYRLVVVTNGALEGEHLEAVNALRERELPSGAPLPYLIEEVDISGTVPEAFQPTLEQEKERELPWVAVMLPPVTQVNEPIYVTELSKTSMDSLTQGDTRNDMAHRLIDGDSAVWVFVESGDQAKDAAARKRLDAALAEAHEELVLPHEMDPNDAEYDMGLSEEVALKLQFSVLTTDRKADPLFWEVVRLLAPEVDDSEEPVAVPVFGRARALTALVGEDIDLEPIMEISAFLVGPCSCQVKAWNPGLDVFVPVDWDGLVYGMIGMDEALPPLQVPRLTAPPPGAEPVETAAQSEAAPQAAPPADVKADGSALVRNLAIVGGLGLLAVVLITIRRLGSGA